MTETLTFIPVTAGRASEEIALQLETAILEGKITIGEKLPSERDLQQTFGTGRGVIREALKILKQKGLIETRKGAHGGAYIIETGISNASESLALFLKQKKIDANFIIEFRESMDRTITALAIARGSIKEKEQLVQYAEGLKKASLHKDPDLHVLVELDRQLNLLLALMTKNPVFQWIMETLQLGFNSLDIALYENPEFRFSTVDNWYATAMLILQNETLRVQSHIDLHYHYLRQCIFSKETNHPLETEKAI